jgi:hypothetical protein
VPISQSVILRCRNCARGNPKYQNGSFVEKKQKNDEEKKWSFMAL